MAASHRPKATFVDLEALGDEVSPEIIHGSIVEKASPTMEHGESQFGLSGVLHRRYNRRPGGRWPGGWWFGTEVDVEYEAHELFRHDLVGWRRDRVEERPRGRPIRVRPDWVCELPSPSNEKRDLIDKMRVLHAAGVPHYWIGNPEDKTLVVHRWEPKGVSDRAYRGVRRGRARRAVRGRRTADRRHVRRHRRRRRTVNARLARQESLRRTRHWRSIFRNDLLERCGGPFTIGRPGVKH